MTGGQIMPPGIKSLPPLAKIAGSLIYGQFGVHFILFSLLIKVVWYFCVKQQKPPGKRFL